MMAAFAGECLEYESKSAGGNMVARSVVSERKMTSDMGVMAGLTSIVSYFDNSGESTGSCAEIFREQNNKAIQKKTMFFDQSIAKW